MTEQRSSRIRLKYGPLEVEIEGDPQMVSEEFRRLREEGIGRLSLAMVRPPEEMIPGAEEREIAEELPPEKKPPVVVSETLQDLAVKDIVKSETQWIAVYGYWLSERESKSTFSRKDIWAKYKESGRDTQSRQTNLSKNIKRTMKRGWLSMLKKNTYALKSEGKKKVEEILLAGKGKARSSV